MIKESINEMIKQTIKTCKTWVKPGEDGLLRFVDPIDGEEISAHYGATHAAAAFIMQGEKLKDNNLISLGYGLLESILERWESSMKLPGFHNDFNNFALCVIWNYFRKKNSQEKYSERIKEIVLATPDSNNPTVNWFPMRWYVNLFRYKWTGDQKYNEVCVKCKTDIKSATYKDGFIDDRLPIGLSFNLQYDVATVAVMQYLKSAGENIDISVELGALINVVAPDGDINYLGRGTNQIFAWGLWIYLLASAGKTEQVAIALEYLKDKVPVMLKNNNMMLNEWPGEEKYMWWDYHYCSVYTAHFLLWLVLAVEQMNAYPVDETYVEPRESGIRIYKSEDYCVVTFDGRSEYLAEQGPCIGVLWTQTDGMVVKGSFGPWQGAFGNKYSPIEATIRNYCGLYSLNQNKDYSKNRYLHKLFSFIREKQSEKVTPLFVNVEIKVTNDNVHIFWKCEHRKMNRRSLFIPCITKKNIQVNVDGKPTQLLNSSMIRNQYSWVSIYQTKCIEGDYWELIVRR